MGCAPSALIGGPELALNEPPRVALKTGVIVNSLAR
jgi:hypothetical protein